MKNTQDICVSFAFLLETGEGAEPPLKIASACGPDFTTISISEGVSFLYIQLFVHSGVFLLKVVCLLS